MKQDIFKIFTIENKIMLTKDTINFLNNHINDKSTLIQVASKYKQMYGSRNCTIPELLSILENTNKNEKKFFDVVNIGKTDNTYKEKHIHLRKKIPHKTTFIYNLKEDVNEHIFGIYYKNRNSEDMLEDELNDIRINLEFNAADIFLVQEMFVCCYGKLKKGIFVVDKIYLPEIEKRKNKRDDLIKTDSMILFFSGLVEISLLKQIISAFESQPEIVVFSGLFGNQLFVFVDNLSVNFPTINFIIIPDVNEGIKSWLPKPYKDDERMKLYAKRNIVFATNPCEIHLYNRKIVVIKDNMVKKLKNKGVFHGDNHIDLLKNILFSQYSYNFLEMPYHFYDEVPDLFLINEDFLGISNENNGINLVINGNFHKENLSFVVYDSCTNSAELSSLKEK